MALETATQKSCFFLQTRMSCCGLNMYYLPNFVIVTDYTPRLELCQAAARHLKSHQKYVEPHKNKLIIHA